MNPFAFLSLAAAFISIVLAALVYSSNTKSNVNRFFAIACILLAYSSFVEFGLRHSTKAPEAIVWAKFDAIWPLLMAVILHFILLFTEHWNLLSKRRTYIAMYLPAICMTFLFIFKPDLFLADSLERYWGWTYEWESNAVAWILNIWFILIAFLAGFFVWRYYRAQTSGLKKTQAKYIAIGYSIPMVIGLSTSIMSLMHGIQVPDLTMSSWAIGGLFVWYGIWKYRMFTVDPTTAAESIFDAMSDLLFLVDREGNITRVNQAALDFLGYREEELMGQTLRPLIKETELTMTNLQQMSVDEINVIKDRHAVMETKSGAFIPVSISPSPINDYNGKTAGFLLVARDMTLRKQAEQKLKEANQKLQEADRLKSIFLASMSHELRTPLNSIIGFTGLILQGLTGDITDEQSHQLSMVKSSAHHLLSLINDVLDLSKLEAGRFELTIDELNLDDLIQDVVNTISPMADMKNLALDTDIQQGLILHSDQRRIKQILINLLGNAVKFTSEGSINLSAGICDEKTLKLAVRDTGVGIKKTDLAQLFRPFKQVQGQLTKNVDGTGLGLYLSKKLANLMGGDIAATSEYGRGSEFSCTIPLDIRTDGHKEDQANP